MKKLIYLFLLLFIAHDVNAQADSVGNQRFLMFVGKYMGNGEFKTNDGKIVTIDPQTKLPKVKNSDGSKTKLDEIEEKLKESEDEFQANVRTQIDAIGDGFQQAAAVDRAFKDIEKEKESLRRLNAIITPFDESIDDFENAQHARDRLRLASFCLNLESETKLIEEFLKTHNSKTNEFTIPEPPKLDFFATCVPCENNNDEKLKKYSKQTDDYITAFYKDAAFYMNKSLGILRQAQLLGIGESQDTYVGDLIGNNSHPGVCFNLNHSLTIVNKAIDELAIYMTNKTFKLYQTYKSDITHLAPVIKSVLENERSMQLLGKNDPSFSNLDEIGHYLAKLPSKYSDERRKRNFKMLAYAAYALTAERETQLCGAGSDDHLGEILSFPYFKLTIETEFKVQEKKADDEETQNTYILGKFKTDINLMAAYDSADCIKWFGVEDNQNVVKWNVLLGQAISDKGSVNYKSPTEMSGSIPGLKLNFCDNTGKAILDIPIPTLAGEKPIWETPNGEMEGADLAQLLTFCFTKMQATQPQPINKDDIEKKSKEMADLTRKMNQGLIKPEVASEQIQKLQAEIMKQIKPSGGGIQNIHIEAPYVNENKTVIDYRFDGKSESILGDKLVYAYMTIKLVHTPKK